MVVDFTAERGTVTFPRDAHGADWPGDGLKGALARHLDRFALREAPLGFDWVDDG